MAITYVAGEKYCLKNDSQDQTRLNVMVETHNVTADTTFTTMSLPTTLKVVLGIVINQLTGTTVPLGIKSTLIPSTAGILTVDIVQDPGGSGALAQLAADADLRIVLFGLSY